MQKITPKSIAATSNVVSSDQPPCLILDGLLMMALNNPKDFQFILAVEADLEGFYRDERYMVLDLP